MPGTNAAPRLCRLRRPNPKCPQSVPDVLCQKGRVTPDSYLCICVCIHLSSYTHINEVSRHHMTIVCVEDASERRGAPRRGMCGSRLVWVVACGWHGVWPGQQGAPCRGCGPRLGRDEGSDPVLGTAVWRGFGERIRGLMVC